MKRTRAFVLNTRIFREHDRIVSFFSEDYGIISGVARGSMKMKSKITGSLIPLTLVSLRFVEPHGKELVVVTGCDAESSLYYSFDMVQVSMATALLAEITLSSHGERDADPDFFRLLTLCHNALKEGKDPQLVSRYFELFTLKLTGFQPPLEEIRNENARGLAHYMLRTNLMEMEQPDHDIVRQLGNYLRQAFRVAFGKQIKCHRIIEILQKKLPAQDVQVTI